MKRILSLLLVLSMAFCLADYVKAEQHNETVIDFSVLNPYEIVLSLCWIHDTLYVLGSKGIYQWSGGEPAIFLDLSGATQFLYVEQEPENEAEKKLWMQAISYLFTDGNNLYGLHPYSGSIYSISDQGLRSIAKLPVDFLSVQSDGMEFFRSILGIALSGQNLCILLGTDDYNDYEKTELIAFDMTSQTVSACSPNFVQGIASGAEGEVILYVRDEQNEGLWLYDTASDTMKEKQCALQETPSGIAWFAQQQVPVYFSANQVKVPDAAGMLITKAYLPVTYGPAQTVASCSETGLYAYPYGQYVFIRDISKGNVEQTILTLAGDLPPDQLIAFSMENPDIVVVSSPASTSDTLRQVAITSDTGVDLFVSTAPGDFAALKQKGFAAPLNDNNELVERALTLYPTVQDAIFDGDTLLAYPISLQPKSWTVNETRWKELGLPKYPKTYDELYDEIALWLEDYADDNTDFTLTDIQQGNQEMLASMLVKEYIFQHESTEERLSFDTSSFRTLMTSMIENASLISEEHEQWGMPLLSSYYQGFGLSYNDDDLMRMLVPPTLNTDEQQELNASMDVLLINAASIHKEAALRFLTYYVTHLDVYTQYALSPDLNEPVRNPNFESRLDILNSELEQLKEQLSSAEASDKNSIRDKIAQKENVIESVKANEWQISDEGIKIYRSAAQRMRIPFDSVYLAERESGGFSAIADVISRYCANGLAIEQLDSFIADLDRITSMVYLEAQ